MAPGQSALAQFLSSTSRSIRSASPRESGVGEGRTAVGVGYGVADGALVGVAVDVGVEPGIEVLADADVGVEARVEVSTDANATMASEDGGAVGVAVRVGENTARSSMIGAELASGVDNDTAVDTVSFGGGT